MVASTSSDGGLRVYDSIDIKPIQPGVEATLVCVHVYYHQSRGRAGRDSNIGLGGFVPPLDNLDGLGGSVLEAVVSARVLANVGASFFFTTATGINRVMEWEDWPAFGGISQGVLAQPI